MRICLVGHHVGQPDEAVRKIAHHLAHGLAKRHQVLPAEVGHPRCWRDIRRFQPRILHFVLSPTLQGLAWAKILSFAYRPAATVVSAPHPHLGVQGRLASWFRPDMLLVQAEDSERLFRSLGYRTRFLPNGVDTQRFLPADATTKARLREKHGIDLDKFVVLHVGAVNRGRNLEGLSNLQGGDTQVLVVGRVSEQGSPRLAARLREAGCLVLTEYLSRLEELYALADCYLFPTRDRRYSVEMPLSVLEAMSCNLPVVTTRFGALPRVFQDGGGLVFVDQDEDFPHALNTARGAAEVSTRDKVLRHDWASIVDELGEIYDSLLAERTAR